MLLSQILKNLNYTCSGFNDCEINDIVYDSRIAAPGTMFVALRGAFTDGHDYVQSAYLNGARVFLAERPLSLAPDATVIMTADTRAALAAVSAEFFGHPEKELDIIGVTGTKGKTTVTHLMKHCLENIGVKSGVIGTVGAYFDGKYIPTVNTTPESYECMKLLRQMADAGCRAVCMEVSSLGLKAHRVDGIHFSTAVFTNLSPDHIGGAEHESFEEYVYWKTRLFSRCDRALLCADDAYSRELEKTLTVPFMTYACFCDADVTAGDIESLRENNFFGAEFTCRYNGGGVKMRTAMPGVFSVQNALAAAAVCFMYGADAEKTAQAMKTAKVKGRNEVIDVPADFDVIIDYAHNGQSFNSVLDTFNEYEHKQIITVFGSVGDRAQLRRQEMGLISGRKADLSVITSDDPGFEDPEKIAREIAGYVEKAGGKYEIIIDRKKAVFRALSAAQSGDIVLILGKGHETAQKINGEKIPYSDHEAVAAFFSEQNSEL